MTQRGWFDGRLLTLCLVLCLVWLGLCFLMIPILVVSNWQKKRIMEAQDYAS